MKSEKLRWGILGAGNIAKKFVLGVQGSYHCDVIAIGSRSKEKAENFAREFDIPGSYGNYEDLLGDPEVDAVYISTPHPFHARWAIQSARAGKHILCEKPLAINYPEAMRVVAAAKENDVSLMEAFMYRCHPQTAKTVELIGEGAIGEVKVIQASFSFHAGFNPDSRLYNNELGGGGILDVGCYPVSMARLIAGSAAGKAFLDPVDVKGTGHLCETGVDDYAAAVLHFPNDVIAQVSCGIGVNQDNICRIYGTEGDIVVPLPWTPGIEGESSAILLHKGGKEEEITVQPDRPLYGIEADTLAENVERRQAPSPAMSWDDTLGNMKTLDAWRDSFGFLYNSERPEGEIPPATGTPPAPRRDAGMLYGEIEGIDKKISRLVMGVDKVFGQNFANAMFDDYYERGGNCFDSAFIYGGGACERELGRWIRMRKLRDNVVLLDKGAHTPHCNPQSLTDQLMESLERLQTDYIDIYMLHRDNPDVPVDEFADVLNEHYDAGRIHAFGGSNWSIDRIEELNRYASSNGLKGFSAISNNFSLARMLQPPWKGCMASSSNEWRRWLEDNQMPLMPWSSQAQGFYAVGDPGNTGNKDMVRCWYSDDNFQRLERARRLASEMEVETINIALAYVLCQPFPTFPLIGPKSVFETLSCFNALDIELTPDQIKWLDLEE